MAKPFLIAAWAGFFMIRTAASLPAAELGGPEVFSAADFGAIPNDAKDDTKALRQLFAEAARQPGSTVQLEAGQYDVSSETAEQSASPIFLIQNANSFRLTGVGSFFSVTGLSRLFEFRNCTNIQIAGIVIDWAIRSSVGVRVVRLETDRVILRQETPGPVTAERPLQGFHFYDSAKHRPEAHRSERSWLDGIQGPTLTQLDAETYSLPLAGYNYPLSGLALKEGDCAIIRFAIYGANALTFDGCKTVSLTEVTIHSAPGMGIAAWGATDVSLQNIQILPAADQWISTSADATHFTDCRGLVTVRDSRFEAMGDDALNMNSSLLRVQAVETPQIVIVERGKPVNSGIAPLPLRADRVAFAPMERPLAFGSGILLDDVARIEGSPLVRLELAEPVPAGIGPGSTVVDLGATASLVVDQVVVRRNRARGFLVQTPQAVRVTHCVFEDQSGPAIQITSDVRRWWEGPPARDVLVSRCRFSGGNDGPGRRAGLLGIFADEAKGVAPYSAHRGIEIRENIFDHGQGPAISIVSARQVTIEANTFAGPGKPVVQEYAEEVMISGSQIQERP